MNKKEDILIWWIDDNKDNKKDADLLESIKESLKVKFLPPGEAWEILGNQGKKPDLVLIDWYLNEKPDSSEKFFSGKGMEMEGRVQEKLPDRPKYVFSTKADSEDFDRKRSTLRRRFDKIIPYSYLQENRGKIYLDAKYYKKVRKVEKGDIEVIYDNLLEAPVVCQEKLNKALPEELQTGIPKNEGNSTGRALMFSRWLRGELFDKPGILNKKLRVATHLGVTEDTFEENKEFVENAKYTGIFHDTNKKNYWWIDKVNKILFSKAQEKDIQETKPWKIGPKLLKVEEEGYSKCHICKERYPQTVAIDRDDGKPFAVHYSCSVLKKRENSVFSPIRYLETSN